MVKDGGADIEAVLIAGHDGVSAVKHKLRTLLDAFLYPIEYRLPVSGADNWAEGGFLIISRAELQLLGEFDKITDKLVRYALLSDDNGQSHAAFARAAERGIDYASCASLESGVLKHKAVVLRLAKSLDSLAVCCRLRINVETDAR